MTGRNLPFLFAKVAAILRTPWLKQETSIFA